jgi:hypothetical protein
VPKIGEMLVAKGLIEPATLERALAEQPRAKMRLVSLLLRRSLVDPDAATLALSEQHGVPAALARHLERRDPSVVPMVTAELARKWVVCPLALGKSGSLVIAARDPGPIVERALEFALRRPLLLAVAPAIEIERIVSSTYGEIDADALELPDPVGRSPLSALDLPADPTAPKIELAEQPQPRRSRSISEFLPAAEVERVVQRSRAASMTSPPSLASRKALELAIETIDGAGSRDLAIRHLLTYCAARWRAVLLLEVEDGTATGLAKHNVDVDPVESILLSAESPSTMQVAVGTRAATTKRPLGPVQDRLTTLLGTLSGAAPIMVAGRPVAILVVGAPMPETPKDPTSDLDKVADALGAAFTRHPDAP